MPFALAHVPLPKFLAAGRHQWLSTWRTHLAGRRCGADWRLNFAALGANSPVYGPRSMTAKRSADAFAGGGATEAAVWPVLASWSYSIRGGLLPMLFFLLLSEVACDDM